MYYSYKSLRSQQYYYHKEKFPYLFNFKSNPYSFVKARFYMEASALLVFFLHKTNIKPNSITVIYCLAGILTGILLSIPKSSCILIALFICFTKGILDWSDGHLARVTGQTSKTDYENTMYSVTFNVNDDLSIGYNHVTSDQTGGTVDAEATSYQAAYTMGGATFRIAEVDIKNRAYGTSAAADVSGTVVSMGLAF